MNLFHIIILIHMNISITHNNSFSKRAIFEGACILSEKSGLTIFQKFRLLDLQHVDY